MLQPMSSSALISADKSALKMPLAAFSSSVWDGRYIHNDSDQRLFGLACLLSGSIVFCSGILDRCGHQLVGIWCPRSRSS
eukprot:3522054-Pyramimonas_sp.AAC.1